MRCVRCGEKAVALAAGRTAYCRQHYLEWFEEKVSRTIKKLGMFGTRDRILVAVSGGKDSLVLWHVLNRLGYSADGVFVHLKIPEYSDKSFEVTKRFAEKEGLRLLVVESSSPVRILARKSRRKTCSACGIVKRHELNRLAHEQGYSVLATGHNLDDETAVLLANVMKWDSQALARQSPVLPGSGKLVKRVKPLCFLTEKHSAQYALLAGIDYVQEECPFSRNASTTFYKKMLNALEQRFPGTKKNVYKRFLEFRKNIPQEEMVLKDCRECGYPTTGDICSFCRIVRGSLQPRC